MNANQADVDVGLLLNTLGKTVKDTETGETFEIESVDPSGENITTSVGEYDGQEFMDKCYSGDIVEV